MAKTTASFFSWALKRNWEKATIHLLDALESKLGRRIPDRIRQHYLLKNSLETANWAENSRLFLGGGMFAGLYLDQRTAQRDAKILQNLDKAHELVLEVITTATEDNYVLKLVNFREWLRSFASVESSFYFRFLDQEDGSRHFIGVEPEEVQVRMKFTYEENHQVEKENWVYELNIEHERLASDFPFAGLHNLVMWASLMEGYCFYYKSKWQAIDLLEKAYLLGMRTLPKDFDDEKDKVLFAYVENRPFYRTCYLYARALYRSGKFEQSIAIFEWSQKVCFETQKDGSMEHYIELYKAHLGAGHLDFVFYAPQDEAIKRPGLDRMVYLYGQVIALFLTKEYNTAEEALKAAKQEYPLAMKTIVNARRPPFKRVKYYGVYGLEVSPEEGSEDQALMFWEETEALWTRYSDIKEFLKTPSKFNKL